jgi:hypothetical protein
VTKLNAVDVVDPLVYAVSVTFWLLVIAPAVAVNKPVSLPPPTLTVVGILMEPLLEDRPTVTPAEGAAAVKVTVQLELARAPIDVGEHIKLLSCAEAPAVAEIVPLPPFKAKESDPPASVAAMTLPSLTVVVVSVGDVVKLAVATTPLLTTELFSPHNTHVYVPVPGVHETDLPAAIAEGPATTETFVMALGEN